MAEQAKVEKGKGRAKAVWNELDTGRASLLSRCEQYASWTLPYLMPKETDTVESTELPVAYGSIGARAVNHLANVITEVLFPVARAFFRLRSSDKMTAVAAASGIDPVRVDNSFGTIEQAALNRVSVANLRSAHVEADKLLIVTGNALVYYPDPQPGQGRIGIVYNLRDYVVQRDRLGDILRLVTRDTMTFNALPQAVQKQAEGPGNFKSTDKVTLYTLVEWDVQTQKYIVSQAVNEVDVQGEGVEATYPKGLLPWIPLTWHRKRTESYGRGLVEDYAYAFNAYNSLSKSLVQFAAIASDIKRCVDPGSNVDVVSLNKTEAGAWVPARKDELWTTSMAGSSLDMQAVASIVQKHEQMLAQAFMLATASVRDAERVTTEEIKLLARELEKSHGGIYSKLAAEWQEKLASLLLIDIGMSPNENIQVQIITGVDALSRTAEIENLYSVVQDLRVVGELPPSLLRWVNEPGLIEYLSANRNIKAGTLFKTSDQVAQDDAARAQAQKDQLNAEAGSKLAVSAAEGAQ